MAINIHCFIFKIHSGFGFINISIIYLVNMYNLCIKEYNWSSSSFYILKS